MDNKFQAYALVTMLILAVSFLVYLVVASPRCLEYEETGHMQCHSTKQNDNVRTDCKQVKRCIRYEKTDD